MQKTHPNPSNDFCPFFSPTSNKWMQAQHLELNLQIEPTYAAMTQVGQFNIWATGPQTFVLGQLGI